MLFQMQNILKCERTHPLTDLIMQPAVAGTRSSDKETGVAGCPMQQIANNWGDL